MNNGKSMNVAECGGSAALNPPEKSEKRSSKGKKKRLRLPTNQFVF
jgi:hypothetical protein